ncbi:hypothetical protein Tco_0284949 [Tanacetum coccineum]
MDYFTLPCEGLFRLLCRGTKSPRQFRLQLKRTKSLPSFEGLNRLEMADPIRSSPLLYRAAPMVSPFMCSDDSESDTEILERHVSPTTYTIPEIPTALILPAPSAIVAPSSEYPLARVFSPPRIRRRRAILIRPGDDIPIGQLYRTYPVGPLSSPSHSSSDHSSSGHSILGHSLSEHTPLMMIHLHHQDLFIHLLVDHHGVSEASSPSTPLSTMYPPTTFESSARDSSSESSVGPSRKRCRSPAATVISPIHATRDLVPSRADLLPPRKRFRDSISPEDSVEEDIDMDVLEDIKADATVVKVAIDRDVEARIDACIDIEVNVGDNVEDEVESSERGTIKVGVDVVSGIDIPDEIPLQRIENIETGQRELESRSLIAGGERASLLEQVTSLERSNVRLRGTMMMERVRADRFWRRVRFIKSELRQILEEALATYEATRAANALEAENQSQNGGDDDNGNNRDGNVKNGNGGNENPNENNKDARPVARECTYQDFMKCQPLNFKGTEGVVGLIRWFEKMEITIGAEAAFAMSWRELMKLIAEVYCPKNEIQKMESEL